MASMDVKSLKGIAIVSIQDGEKVGTLDNMVFDLQERRVIAFKIRKSSMPGSGRFLISLDDITSVGPDAVMIPDKQCLRNEKDDRDFHKRPDLSAIAGLRVVTENGMYVGNLATLQFDQKTGQLTAIETTGSGIIDLLRRNKVIEITDVISIGTDVVVVPDRYAPEESDQASDEVQRNGTKKSSAEENERIMELPARSDNPGH